jgi:hypothetical protein
MTTDKHQIRRGRGRLTDTDDRQPHPLLTPLTVAQARRLVRLAETAAAERGFAMRYDGSAALVPIEAGDRTGETAQASDDDQAARTTAETTAGMRAGLGNLALKVADLPRQLWRAAVNDHFDQMPRFDDIATVPDDLENELYLRVACAANQSPEMVRDAPEFVPGVVTVPATYVGRAVAMHFDVDRLGLTRERATRIGLANLRRLRDEVHTVRLGGAELTMLTGGMFTASRALVFDTVLRESLRVEDPAHGCLVALPARDMLLVHVLRDQTALNALAALASRAAELFNTSPGMVSPHVYYVRDNQWHQVTDYSTGTFHLHDVPPLVEALEQVGVSGLAA